MSRFRRNGTCSGDNLVRAFDDELSRRLERLVPQRRQRLALRRIVIGLRFLQALPFRDPETLGWVAYQSNDLSRSDDAWNAAGGLGRRLGLRRVLGKRRGV